MSVSYSLVDGLVKKTITVTAKEETLDWAKKDEVVKEIEREIAHCQEVIDIYTAKKAEEEAKLAAVNALK